MSINIDEIRETLNECYEDIVHDKAATNEMVVDDLMLALGYNKKRDKSVSRCFNSDVDWVVKNDSGGLAVKVYAAAENISEAEFNSAVAFVTKENIPVLVVTNGENIEVYVKNQDTYTRAIDIDIHKDLGDKGNAVLSAISKKGFDLNYLVEITTVAVITVDNVKDIIINNKEKLSAFLIDMVNEQFSDAANVNEVCGQVATLILDKLNIQDTTDKQKVAIESYMEKIRQMSDVLNEKENKIHELNKLNAELQDELDKSSGAAHRQALELLSVMDADNDAERSYVAIINEEVIQYTELHSFVGRVLQELYELKSFESESYIYNGSIFRIRQENVKYNDMVLGNKAFDVLISNDDEDDALRKLKTIFSHFDDIVFECKKIGHLHHNQQTGIDDTLLENVGELVIDDDVADDVVADDVVENVDDGVDNVADSAVDSVDDSVGGTDDSVGGAVEDADTPVNADIAEDGNDEADETAVLSDEDTEDADIFNDEDTEDTDIFSDEDTEDTDIFSDEDTEDTDIFSDEEDESIDEESIFDDSEDESTDDEDIFSDEEDESIDDEGLFSDEEDEDVDFIDDDEDGDDVFDNDEDDEAFDNDDEFNESDFDEEEADEVIDIESDDISMDGEEDAEETIEEDTDADESIEDTDESTEDADDVVIELGTDDGTNEITEGADISSEDTGVQEDTTDEQIEEAVETEDTSNETDDNSSEIDFNDTVEDTDQVIEGFDDDVEESSDNTQQALLVCQLSDIDRLVWTDEDVKFYNIKYLGSNNVTYNINPAGEEMSFTAILCKCVDAVMAIQQYEGDKKTIIKLKQKKNLEQANTLIKRYTEEYRGYPRITGTKYTVDGIDSIPSLTVVLSDICRALNVDMSELFVYFDVDTSSQYIIENYGYDESAIQLREYDMYKKNDERVATGIAVIRGDIFNNTIITRKSINVHKDIINRTLAVRTKYLGKVFNSKDDFIEVVEDMLIEAAKQGISFNTDAVGLVIGEDHKLISRNAAEVGESYSTLDIAGHTIYCANIEEWQIPASLIKMHTVIFNNASIAVKILADIDAINYYGAEYDVMEPSDSLAIKSFADYMAGCVKA